MRFSVTGLMALSVALTACQQTKLSSPTAQPAQQQPTATNTSPPPPNTQRNPPPTVNNPQPPPPPPQRPVTFNPPPPPPPVTVAPPPPPPPPGTVAPPPPNTFTNNPPPTWNNPPAPGPVQPTTPFVNNPQPPPPPVVNNPVSNPTRPTFTPVPVQPQQPVITSNPPQPIDHPTSNPTVVNPPFTSPPVVNNPPPVVNNPPPQTPPTFTNPPPVVNNPLPPVTQQPPPLAPQNVDPVVQPNFQAAPAPIPFNSQPPQTIPSQPTNFGANGPEQQILPAPPLPRENWLKPPSQSLRSRREEYLPAPSRPQQNAPALGSGSNPQATPQRPQVNGATPPSPSASSAPTQAECSAVPVTNGSTKKKLDLLFVLDASASLRGGIHKETGGQLGQLAREMRFFVPQLPADTDIHIGIIPGHGPTEGKTVAHNYHGKLVPILGTRDFVIDSEKVNAACKNDQKCVRDRIATLLEKTMRALPKDETIADGELSLYSLYDSIKIPELFQKSVEQGMFRKDATLAIIIISDDHDGCFDFTGTPYSPIHRDRQGNIQPGLDKTSQRTLDQVCKHAINGGPFKAIHAYQAVHELKGDNLIATGVIYLDNANIPHNTGVSLPENVGHGFIDFIELAHGQAADLGLVTNLNTDRMEFSSKSQFSFLGKYTSDRMKFTSQFSCSSDVHPSAVNVTTLQVTLRDSRTQQPIAVFSGACGQGVKCPAGVAGSASATIAMGPQGNNPYLLVNVDPAAVAKVLKGREDIRTEAKITFQLRSDMNADGRQLHDRHN